MNSIVRLKPMHPADNDYKSGITEKLRKRLQGRIHQAFIFGSFTTPAFHGNSDLDLILICQTDKPFVERGRAFLDLFDLGISIDLLVYTPEEWEELQKEQPSGFWKTARQSLIRIL